MDAHPGTVGPPETAGALGGELLLPPEARSAGAARRFVREVLEGAGRSGWVDDAELAVSEVVTNGVLHAHTDLVLRARLLPDGLEVEVADGSDRLPSQRHGGSTPATTGRGLELVAALTLDCGVRPEPGGKVVWFVVGDRPVTPEPDESDLLSAWGLDDVWVPEQPLPQTPSPQRREVSLQGLPTTLWLAAREHHQALLRELVLYLAEHGDADGTVPDLAAADTARALVWTQVLAQVEQARRDGTAERPVPDGHPSPLPEVPATVDVQLQVQPSDGGCFSALQDALDAGEQLARRDLLLVRPGLPEVVAVRDWACEQVVAQLAGVRPAPWGGTDHSRFDVREDLTPPAWDASVVTSSTRGVVAADDANRIIAVSPSLAALVGWEPADLVGRRVVALIPPALREAHVAGFSRHLTTGQAHVLGVDLELPVLHRDGSQLVCRFLVERVDAHGRGVYLAWIDPV